MKNRSHLWISIIGALSRRACIPRQMEGFVLDIFLARRLMEDLGFPTLDRAAQLDLSVFLNIVPQGA